jgi:hypothetical protein
VVRDENGFGIFRNSGNRFRFFPIGIVSIGISRNRNRSYRNRYSPLPTIFFGYCFESEFTEFKIRNLPKLLTSLAQIPNSQLMAHGLASSPPQATHLSSARRTSVALSQAQRSRTGTPHTAATASRHCSLLCSALHAVPPNFVTHLPSLCWAARADHGQTHCPPILALWPWMHTPPGEGPALAAAIGAHTHAPPCRRSSS